MKRYGLIVTVVGIGFSLMVGGCAKEPTQEIAGAQAAVAAAKNAGADKYLAKDYATMDEMLKTSLAEAQKQKGANPLSRNYEKVKANLVSITTMAKSLTEKAAAEKAKVQAYVESALAKLNSTAAEAKELVKKAPKKTKDAKVAVEAKAKEIEAAAAKAAEVEKLKATGDFAEARDAANAAIAELESIKAELSAVPQKVEAKVKAKGKKKR
jgi:hypothetical protein